MAHFSRCDQHAVGIGKGGLHGVSTDAARVFPEDMPFHSPSRSEVSAELCLERGARGLMVGEVEHHEVTRMAQVGRRFSGIHPGKDRQALR